MKNILVSLYFLCCPCYIFANGQVSSHNGQGVKIPGHKEVVLSLEQKYAVAIEKLNNCLEARLAETKITFTSKKSYHLMMGYAAQTDVCRKEMETNCRGSGGSLAGYQFRAKEWVCAAICAQW